MTVKQLREVIERLDPEAEVLATDDALALRHHEVDGALRVKWDGDWFQAPGRRAGRANAVLLVLGRTHC